MGHLCLIRTFSVLDVLAGTEPDVAMAVLKELHSHLQNLKVPELLDVVTDSETLQLAELTRLSLLKQSEAHAVLVSCQVANVVFFTQIGFTLVDGRVELEADGFTYASLVRNTCLDKLNCFEEGVFGAALFKQPGHLVLVKDLN